eukprot:TRINITY_DN493_c1_g1_i1.p2 TRINITY_DN493_c1_g1~~TRINITY_DN493_c1_g1_i1.p2  ORF type:complete len:463 (-),score=52.76 TRINITY_DN493_c1_g1_i1:164-1453(-)
MNQLLRQLTRLSLNTQHYKGILFSTTYRPFLPEQNTNNLIIYRSIVLQSIFERLKEGDQKTKGVESETQNNPVQRQLSGSSTLDPVSLIHQELNCISERVRASVISDIPALGRAAEYFFRVGAEGKRVRPTVILLLASALPAASVQFSQDWLRADFSPAGEHTINVRRRQQRIAEVAEMIHVASLLHDDVIDNASTRRGMAALNALMGNKLAILAGDFLLARASLTLAALRNTEIVELLSKVLEDLVSGEIMQISGSEKQMNNLEYYQRKTYYKTASLLANSAKAVAKIGGNSPEVCSIAYEYGRHLGMAFQVQDDIMDFTSSSSIMGKPGLNDLKSGIATAPVIFAAEQFPELIPLIQRKFKYEDDVDVAANLVFQSNGIQRSKELAQQHVMSAKDQINQLPETDSTYVLACREALLQMADKVVNRQK